MVTPVLQGFRLLPSWLITWIYCKIDTVDLEPLRIKFSTGRNKKHMMAMVTDIGALITRSDNIRGGRPRVAGTGVTMHPLLDGTSWD